MEFPGCPQWVQLSPGGAVVSTAPTNLKAPATLLVQFLLWQAAKPSGDNCTPFFFKALLYI